ncbi:MAG: hypothetical protein O6932_04600 [Gammaproteobacteria bacterium]|nr:hypothetical protein [Gammaproteobacteria bacterium]
MSRSSLSPHRLSPSSSLMETATILPAIAIAPGFEYGIENMTGAVADKPIERLFIILLIA